MQDTSTAFVTFNSRLQQAAAVQGLQYHDEGVWKTTQAPEPRAVLWDNVTMRQWQREWRSYFVWIFFVIMMLCASPLYQCNGPSLHTFTIIGCCLDSRAGPWPGSVRGLLKVCQGLLEVCQVGERGETKACVWLHEPPAALARNLVDQTINSPMILWMGTASFSV